MLAEFDRKRQADLSGTDHSNATIVIIEVVFWLTFCRYHKLSFHNISQSQRFELLFGDRFVLNLLESNDVGAFSTIIGVIQDLKDVVGQVSANQEWCLRLPLMFFEEAVQIL
jgi:hypothetical protein